VVGDILPHYTINRSQQVFGSLMNDKDPKHYRSISLVLKR